MQKQNEEIERPSKFCLRLWKEFYVEGKMSFHEYQQELFRLQRLWDSSRKQLLALMEAENGTR